MSNTQAIMAYEPVSSEVGTEAPNMAAVDHTFGNIYFADQSGNTDAGFRIFDTWRNGGVETRARNLADMTGQQGGISIISSICALLYNRQWLAWDMGASNSNQVGYVRARNLDFMGSFGVPGSGLGPSSGQRKVAWLGMRAIQDGRGGDYLIGQPVINSLTEIDVLSVGQGWVQSYTITEPHCLLGAPPDGSGNFAYALGQPSARTSNFTLYKIAVNAAALQGTTGQLANVTTQGTINFASIDPTWTGIDQSWGIMWDQTDGNPIVALATNDSVTNATYLVKLSGGTAAVIWKLPLPTSNWDSQTMGMSLIKNGTYWYNTGTKVGFFTAVIYQINTVTGTIANTYPFGPAGAEAALGARQISEDVNNSIYYWGSWTGADTPTVNFVGNYMGTLGNHNASGQPCRFFPNTGAPAPPPDVIAGAPRQRAWTFTLDGHTFYVLDLGTEGTFAYDTSTQQWSKFITQGYLNWNFRNGFQWGQRVVAGDTDTGQLYEQNPGSSLKDNGTIDIQHVVTGGLIKRNRVYSSVESLRLSMSAGLLDDTSTATVTLAFSDDNGNTWTTMDTYNLTEADFSAEIQWPSLGAFAAPGRVFSIVDVGGFLSISGCDAMLDNFDDDGNTQTQGQ